MEWKSQKEICAELKISRTTLHRRIKDGKVEKANVGNGKVLYRSVVSKNETGLLQNETRNETNGLIETLVDLVKKKGDELQAKDEELKQERLKREELQKQKTHFEIEYYKLQGEMKLLTTGKKSFLSRLQFWKKGEAV